METVGLPKLGGVAGPLAEYRTVDPASGEPLAPAAEGELAVRGAIVTHGYHDAPEATAEVLGEDGWLRSGDLGRIGLDGYLRLTGRSKDLYRCGSETVTPVEVESRLAERADVSQAHVVPIPDDRMGEVGVAFVVPAAGAEPDPADLIAHCRATLARFKVPEHIVFVVRSSRSPRRARSASSCWRAARARSWAPGHRPSARRSRPRAPRRRTSTARVPRRT